MGKKIAAAVPAVQKEESETIQRKKENAQKLDRQMKAIRAQVLQKVDLKQIQKAVTALQQFKKSQKNEKNLLSDPNALVTLTFTMTKLPVKPSQRPQLVKIPHPYLSKQDNSRVCLFVKDPARAFKDQIEELQIPTIAKVIGFDKLKRNFK